MTIYEESREIQRRLGELMTKVNTIEGQARKKCGESYRQGYEDAKAELADGTARREGWEQMLRACRAVACFPNSGGMSIQDMNRIFGDSSVSNIFSTRTAEEIIRAVEDWEQEKGTFEVGDEVVLPSGYEGIVVNMKDENICVLLLKDPGGKEHAWCNEADLRWTGQNIFKTDGKEGEG